MCMTRSLMKEHDTKHEVTNHDTYTYATFTALTITQTGRQVIHGFTEITCLVHLCTVMFTIYCGILIW